MIKHKYFSKLAVLLVLALGLSACGFHLRGNIPLPDAVKNMYVQAPEGTFKEQLLDLLESAGANVAASQAGAGVTLDVLRAQSNRTVGTLNERGKANSYNILFDVDYVLRDSQGSEIRRATLKESRRYNFDPELVIESESEEAELLEDMEQAIAIRIMRQLAAITDIGAAKAKAAAAAKAQGTQSTTTQGSSSQSTNAQEPN